MNCTPTPKAHWSSQPKSRSVPVELPVGFAGAKNEPAGPESATLSWVLDQFIHFTSAETTTRWCGFTAMPTEACCGKFRSSS